MLELQFQNPTKTYSTHANAVKAIEKVYEKLGGTNDQLAYIVASTPDGRFFPVVIPAESQVQTAIIMGHNGIASLRR